MANFYTVQVIEIETGRKMYIGGTWKEEGKRFIEFDFVSSKLYANTFNKTGLIQVLKSLNDLGYDVTFIRASGPSHLTGNLI